MLKFFFTLVCCGLISSACRSTNKTVAQKSTATGIDGYVYEETGNQMPMVNAPKRTPKALKTTVYIYELTNINQVTRNGTQPFYKAVRTKLIKSVNSDTAGYFFAELPVGRYSLFTKVNGELFANNFDANNNIAPATVTAGKLTRVNITVNANATY